MMRIAALTLPSLLALSAAACRPASTSLTVPASAPDTLGKVRTEVREALAAEDAFEPAQCVAWIARLEALYERDPSGYTVALLDAGRIARSCGRPADARVHYKRAAAEGPRWIQAEAALGVAQAHRIDGTLTDIEQSLRWALRRNPNHVQARLMLARVLLQRHVSGDGGRGSRTKIPMRRAQVPEAIAQCRTLLEADPGLHEARVLLARGLLLADDPERRHYIATRILVAPTLDNHDSKLKAEAMVIIGLAALRSRDENVALRHFERALDVDPEQAEAAGQAAIIFVKMRDYGRALELLAVALSAPHFIDERTLLWAQASAYAHLDQKGRAKHVLERLYELDPAFDGPDG